MKINFDKKTGSVNLDNEAVKAIRFVYGLNTDLRVRLKHIPKDFFYDWIDENKYRIFGIGIMDCDSDTQDKIITRTVAQIIR